MASGFICLAVVAFYGVACFKLPWVADFYRHAASVRSFQVDTLHPAHEAMSGASVSILHAPYHLVLGVLARILSISPYRVLQLAGVFNLSLFLVGVVLFVRAHTSSRVHGLAPGLLILLNLFFRQKTFSWSSETDVVTLRYIQAYPSFFAWGAALMAFAIARRFMFEGCLRRLGWISFILAFTILSHPLTGGWVFGLVPVIAFHACVFDTAPRSRFAPMIGAVALGTIAALAWPYAPGLRGFVAYARQPEAALFAEHPFKDMPSVYLAGAVALGYGLWRRQRSAFPVYWGATSLGLFASWALGVSYGARFVFFQLFLVHALIAEKVALAIAELLDRSGEQSALRMPSAQASSLEAHSGPPLDLRSRESKGSRAFGLPLAQRSSKGGYALARSPLPPTLFLLTLALLIVPVVWQRVLAIHDLPHTLALLRAPSSHDAHYASFARVGRSLSVEDVVATEPTARAYALAEVTGARVLLAPAAFDHPEYAARFEVVDALTRTSSTTPPPIAALAQFGVTRIVLTEPSPGIVKGLERCCGAPTVAADGIVVHDLARCSMCRPADGAVR